MRVLLVAIGLVVVSGCVTPSIPIPPPDPARMSFGLSGEPGSRKASFSYPPNINFINSVVFVYNRDLGVGIIEAARPDGSVGPTAGVAADIGNQMIVSFQRDDQTVSTCVRLREGAQSSTDYCDP